MALILRSFWVFKPNFLLSQWSFFIQKPDPFSRDPFFVYFQFYKVCYCCLLMLFVIVLNNCFKIYFFLQSMEKEILGKSGTPISSKLFCIAFVFNSQIAVFWCQNDSFRLLKILNISLRCANKASHM